MDREHRRRDGNSRRWVRPDEDQHQRDGRREDRGQRRSDGNERHRDKDRHGPGGDDRAPDEREQHSGNGEQAERRHDGAARERHQVWSPSSDERATDR
jgi:hypothetical protein